MLRQNYCDECEHDCNVNGKEVCVPLAPGNRHYDEIMRQVDAGTLTIADAE